MKPDGEKYKIKKVRADQLTVDRIYQREPKRSHYRAIAAKLDFDALGIFVVSERSDGSLVIIDGQHRWKALHEQGVAEWEVLCRVYVGLKIEREAAMYRELNTTQKTTAWDDFKAGLAEKDPECLNIRAVANRAGWEISNQAGPGRVCCVSTVRQIFRKRMGVALLQRSLEDARSAWGDNPAGVERHILFGLSVIHQQFDGQLDRPQFIAKLAKASGGPAGILGIARQLSSIRSQSIGHLCAAVMVEHYNRGRRASRLSDL